MSGIRSGPEDDDLRRRFAELKAFDRGRTPRFEATLAEARSRVGRGAVGPAIAWRAAAAVLLLIAAGALGARVLRHRASPERLAVAAWRSPTAFLLPRPGAGILESLAPLSASVIHLDASSTRRGPSLSQ